ncbi:MAG: hypothetical protein HUK40_02305 [Desulfobacter sp.]|nr:hypothetical protein [Desulfobacter sp.]WDP85354.1 MAG: hypothetical protein HUN05_09600 [Desulfobacter sp.]
MDIKHHFEVAWNLCLANIVPLIILTLVTMALSVVTLGILAPVAFAGYVWSLYQLLNTGREPRAQDVLSQMRLFLPLALFTFLVFIITLIGFTLLIVPGIIFSLAIGYTCFYMIPIMVDQKSGIVDAIKKSIAMMTRTNVVDHLIVFIIFTVLTAVGGSSFIGFIVLQPFATLFYLSVYKDTVN